MRKIFTLTTLAFISIAASAYNVELNGVYFNITSENTCEVTSKTSNFNSYSGDVTVPKSVVYEGDTYIVSGVGDYAFYNSTSLKSVKLPATVVYIGSKAFAGCTKLTSVDLPASVTTIKDGAFSNCSQLTGITLPASLTTIGNSAFSRSGIAEANIPATVTSIGSSAFNDCTNLATVKMQKSVANVGEDAFSGCFISSKKFSVNGALGAKANNNWGAKLVDERKADGLCISGNTLVKYLGKANTITIPSSINTIGREAFLESGITSVVIPQSVTRIDDSAFQNCVNLTSLKIGSAVKEIGREAFKHCIALTSIDIPSSVTTIEDGAFQDCSELTALTIPSSVTHVGDDAFHFCARMKTVTIPASVASLGERAFKNCSDIEDVYVFWANPKSMPESAFDKSSAGPVFKNLHVPAGTKAKYKAVMPWKMFRNIIEGGAAATEEAPVVTTPAKPMTQAIQTIQTADANFGDNFLKRLEGATKDMQNVSSLTEMTKMTGELESLEKGLENELPQWLSNLEKTDAKAAKNYKKKIEKAVATFQKVVDLKVKQLSR